MKRKRYLVNVMFDLEAFNMKEAQRAADHLVREAVKPYVYISDKDSGLTYEHFADGKWKKRQRA